MYSAMLSYLDDMVGTVRDSQIQREMWKHAVIVVASDNWGPASFGGASNYPLRL